MASTDFYSTAHLFVAAVRVLTHQNSVPPSIESVCKMLSISEERGHHICRKLTETGIVDVVSGAYGTKLFIKNHLALEDIPRGETDSKLDEALKQFQAGKKDFTRKIESFQASQEEKKKKLFAELEQKLKKGSRR